MTENEMEEKESFAELFEASQEKMGRKFFPGEKVSGKVLKLSRDTIFVDLGGKSEGIADISEFLGKDGNPTLKEGDWIESFVDPGWNSSHKGNEGPRP
jgi:small subunit ribosomal protein S1